MSTTVQKTGTGEFLVMLSLEQQAKVKPYRKSVKLKSKAGLRKKMKCQNRDWLIGWLIENQQFYIKDKEFEHF